MIQTIPKEFTLEEFIKLPETKPAQEFINGQILQKPMPQGKHSRIQGKFVSIIEALAKEPPVAFAFPELRCTFGGRSIVPDIVVLLAERIPRDENGDIANVVATYPDWTIEILSPEQKPNKVIGNILHCLRYGCQLGWFVDPDDRSILTFLPGQQPELKQGSDALPILEGIVLEVRVDLIFSWLKL
jgi:Uma2 family endonuclease